MSSITTAHDVSLMICRSSPDLWPLPILLPESSTTCCPSYDLLLVIQCLILSHFTPWPVVHSGTLPPVHHLVFVPHMPCSSCCLSCCLPLSDYHLFITWPAHNTTWPAVHRMICSCHIIMTNFFYPTFKQHRLALDAYSAALMNRKQNKEYDRALKPLGWYMSDGWGICWK